MYDEGDFAPSISCELHFLQTPLSQRKVLMSTETFLDGCNRQLA